MQECVERIPSIRPLFIPAMLGQGAAAIRVPRLDYVFTKAPDDKMGRKRCRAGFITSVYVANEF